LRRWVRNATGPDPGSASGFWDWVKQVWALLVLWFDQGTEMVAEDVITNCHGSPENFAQEVYDHKDVDKPRDVEGLRDDSAFYDAVSIDEDTCEDVEELIEDIHELRIPGTPTDVAQVILMLRARVADFTVAGQDCFDDSDCDESEAIEEYMRDEEPWMLSAQSALDTFFDGGPGYAGRWRPETGFSPMTHFLDLLSPWASASSAQIGPDDIDGLRRVLGRHHAIDGYSLDPSAVPFRPFPRLLEGLGLKPYELDDFIRKSARQFHLRVAPSTFYLLMRRRLCDAPTHGTLHTEDGLGLTDCSAAGVDPANLEGQRLTDITMPPADLGALEGFSAWVYGDGPFAITHRDQTGGTRLFSALDRGYPFSHLLQGESFVAERPLYQCEEPLHCDRQDGGRLAWLMDAAGPNGRYDALRRLQALALALHMLQDMSVPHHLAPTTAYGHGPYESFAEQRLLSKAPEPELYRLDVWLGGEGGRDQIGDILLVDPMQPQVRIDAAGSLDEAELDGMLAPLARPSGDRDEDFWDRADRAWQTIHDDMTAMGVGTPCEGRFSIRRLIRTVALQTIRAIDSSGRLVSFADHDGAELSVDADGSTFPSGPEGGYDGAAGFWVASAWAINKNRNNPERMKVPDVWQAAIDETAPYMVAGGALLLLEAWKARTSDEPTAVTCDGGPPDVLVPADIPAGDGEPLCGETTTEEIQACLDLLAPDARCDALLAGMPRECRAVSDRREYGEFCKNIADRYAFCVCRARRIGSEPGKDEARCFTDRMRRERLDDLFFNQAAIDQVTYYHHTGVARSDRDVDGIPDSVDRCPDEPPRSSVSLPLVPISGEVCLLPAEAANLCSYGCSTRGM